MPPREAAAGLIIVLNRRRVAERRGRVLLLNAGAEFEKGRPKNLIPCRDVPRLAKVVTNAELRSIFQGLGYRWGGSA